MARCPLPVARRERSPSTSDEPQATSDEQRASPRHPAQGGQTNPFPTLLHLNLPPFQPLAAPHPRQLARLPLTLGPGDVLHADDNPQIPNRSPQRSKIPRPQNPRRTRPFRSQLHPPRPHLRTHPPQHRVRSRIPNLPRLLLPRARPAEPARSRPRRAARRRPLAPPAHPVHRNRRSRASGKSSPSSTTIAVSPSPSAPSATNRAPSRSSTATRPATSAPASRSSRPSPCSERFFQTNPSAPPTRRFPPQSRPREPCGAPGRTPRPSQAPPLPPRNRASAP
jgi:hypothetical protein